MSGFNDLSRRHLLRVGAVSTAVSMSGWMGQLALAAEEKKVKPKRSCILLWMNGGPSTIDLWDLKPGHENGGPYKQIEAAPENAGVPQTDAQALEESPQNYFEHHVKLLRAVGAPRERLVEVCDRHGAHLSRNALREAAAGREERFVTLRCYLAGRQTSDARRDALIADLKSLGEEILEYESEYSVFDTNLELDAGWLNPEEGRTA